MADLRISLGEAERGLPPVCMCCGAAADSTTNRKMSWHPPWIGVLILLGLIGVVLYAVFASMMSKRALLAAPLCERHRNHWKMRLVIILVSLLMMTVLGGLAIAVVATDVRGPTVEMLKGISCGVTIFLALAWLILLVTLQNTSIRPKEITDVDLFLTGVSPAFIEAVDEQHAHDRRRRRSRRRRYDEDEDDED